MKRIRLLLLSSLLCAGALLLLVPDSFAQASDSSVARAFDVLHYDAQVKADIVNKSVSGKVYIRFTSSANELSVVELDRGELTIDAVREKGVAQKFVTDAGRLRVSLSRPAKEGEARELEVEYHGTPRRGIRFFPERAEVYTVFSTSQWMVCVDAPDDRATLRLTLILPAGLGVVANGRMVSQRALPGDEVAYEWRQERAVPSYTFGFAAGRFRTLTEGHGRVRLNYMAAQYSDDELRRIFRDTADMIDFYEERAGVRYADATYTQVLATRGPDQEMSGFTVLNEVYGRGVLASERDVWLGAHELAHQWWGNMVTCRDWNHFWLNEGMASFMADAYKEHRFGREEYLREIEASRARYQKVRDAGKDKSLVFPDWSHPTAEDRTLVYHKGAYVLHLLREELGERAFWSGIRRYTRAYFGKSVTTPDFQRAMEEASGRNLTAFFSKWVYLTEAMKDAH